MTRADTDSPRCINDADGPEQVFIVRQRLAHAHENDVVDALIRFSLNRDDLIDNFIGVQVALPAIQTACAEFAAVGASYLSRNANRSSIRTQPIQRG